MYTEAEAEAILLDQLKEFKISRPEFIKMIHESLDREIRESKLAGPKKISVFSINGETASSFGSGLVEESKLNDLYIRNDIVVPVKNMVKYFMH